MILVDCGYSLEIYGATPPTPAGSSASFTLYARGGLAPYSFTLADSTLPLGEWTLTDNGDGSATLASASADTAGDFSIMLHVEDANRIPVEQRFDIRVAAQPLAWVGTLDADFYVGVPYSSSITLEGGIAPYSVPYIAGLPDGITFELVDDTFTIEGTPTGLGFPAGYTHSVPVGFTGTDSASGSVLFEQTLTLHITPLAMAGDYDDAVQGVVYSDTLPATGGVGAKTYTKPTGTLPAGLSLNAATSEISGTPTTVASYSFVTRATDVNGNTVDSSTQNVDVTAPPVVVTTWNPADKAAGITLSNANRDIVGTGAWGTIRSVKGYTTGKFYVEFDILGVNTGGDNGPMYGIARLAKALNTFLWDGADGAGQNANIFSGQYYNFAAIGSSTGTGTIGGPTTRPQFVARHRFAIDIGAGKIWTPGQLTVGNIGKFAVSDATIAAGSTPNLTFTPGGVAVYLAASVINSATSLRLVAHPSDWLYSAPSGFGPWLA